MVTQQIVRVENAALSVLGMRERTPADHLSKGWGTQGLRPAKLLVGAFHLEVPPVF